MEDKVQILRRIKEVLEKASSEKRDDNKVAEILVSLLSAAEVEETDL